MNLTLMVEIISGVFNKCHMKKTTCEILEILTNLQLSQMSKDKIYSQNISE